MAIEGHRCYSSANISETVPEKDILTMDN